MSYKASILIKGAVTKHLYSKNNLGLIRVRAISQLNEKWNWIGGLCPLRVDLYESLEVMSGNRTKWKLIETVLPIAPKAAIAKAEGGKP